METFSVHSSHATVLLNATDMREINLLEPEIFSSLMKPLSRFSFYCDT